MALKSVLGCVFSQVGWGEFSKKPTGFIRVGKDCNGFNGISRNCGIRCRGDENLSSNSSSEATSLVKKDTSSLPRPLTVSDFSSFPINGSKMRISFKGEPGSYSEDAALKAHPQSETVPCSEFEEAFKAVELWLAERAVLPIENSLSGSIHRNYDLLLRHRLHIVGEVQLPVNFCLLALPGIPLEQLKRVLSHPQALEQSDDFLSKLGVVRENVEDTAVAAQLVVSKKMYDAGVIATARAADIYGLNIVAKTIQDDPDNITRFLVLARDPIIPRADKVFKTSIVFTLNEGPGVIFKALTVFALRDIKLTKIESRPQRKQPLRVVDDSNNGTAKYFDYLFYIDFEASMAEPRAQNALIHLQNVGILHTQQFAMELMASESLDVHASPIMIFFNSGVNLFKTDEGC